MRYYMHISYTVYDMHVAYIIYMIYLPYIMFYEIEIELGQKFCNREGLGSFGRIEILLLFASIFSTAQ